MVLSHSAAPGAKSNALDPATFAPTVKPWLEVLAFVLDGYPAPLTAKAVRLIICTMLDQRIRLDTEWYEFTSETAPDDSLEDILFRGTQA